MRLLRPLDSRPLRPMPILWLLVPWITLIVWSGAVAGSGIRNIGTVGSAGVIAALLIVATALGISAWALGLLAWTWLWIALAVPGSRRAGMWIAALLLAAPWLVPTRGDVRVVAAGFASLPLVASVAVVYAIIVARVRARRLWARSDLAGV